MCVVVLWCRSVVVFSCKILQHYDTTTLQYHNTKNDLLYQYNGISRQAD